MIDKLKLSTIDNFPVSECTIQDEDEPDVYHSDKVYIVICINTKLKGQYTITFAKPYVQRPHRSDFHFICGWLTLYQNSILGNIQSSCHTDCDFVFMFRPVDDKYLAIDSKLFGQIRYAIKRIA